MNLTINYAIIVTYILQIEINFTLQVRSRLARVVQRTRTHAAPSHCHRLLLAEQPLPMFWELVCSSLDPLAHFQILPAAREPTENRLIF